MFLATPAYGHWNSGDPAKVVQAPDLSTNGIDVNSSYNYILADDFESNLGAVRDEARKTIGLLRRANKYLRDSAVEREQETDGDKQRISELEGTVERLQAPIRSAFTEAKGAQETVQRIKNTANDIRGELHKRVNRVCRMLGERYSEKRNNHEYRYNRRSNLNPLFH